MVRDLGNPLGNPLGLSVKKEVATSQNVTTDNTHYSFSELSTVYDGNGSTGNTALLYFDDSHIYLANANSVAGAKTTLNRAGNALTSLTSLSSLFTASFTSIGNYTIRISDTLIACPSNGYKITRSGDSLTYTLCVPASGTLSVGGYAYTNNVLQLRKNPNGGYVGVAQDTTTTSYVNIFIMAESLTVLSSFRVTASDSYSLLSVFIDDGMLILAGTDTSQRVRITLVDLASYSVAVATKTITLNAKVESNAVTSTKVHGFSYDRKQKRVYPFIGYVYGSSQFPSSYYMTIDTKNKYLIHPDGTFNTDITYTEDTGKTSLAYYGSSANYVLNLFIGIAFTTIMYNEYGNLYLAHYDKDPATAYDTTLPCAEFSFSNNTGLTFRDARKFLSNSTYKAELLAYSTDLYRCKYNAEPMYGFSNKIQAAPMPIGDDLFLSGGLRSNNDGWQHIKLFKRVTA